MRLGREGEFLGFRVLPFDAAQMKKGGDSDKGGGNSWV